MKNILLFISVEESFLIIFIAVLIFGPKNIPIIARGLGEGIRFLKKTTKQIKKEIIEKHNENNKNE